MREVECKLLERKHSGDKSNYLLESLRLDHQTLKSMMFAEVYIPFIKVISHFLKIWYNLKE